MQPDDTLIEFERWVKQMPRAELGGLLKEYISESNHNSWDGFERRNLTGVRRFLEDLMLYHGSFENAQELGTKITNLNPVP